MNQKNAVNITITPKLFYKKPNNERKPDCTYIQPEGEDYYECSNCDFQMSIGNYSLNEKDINYCPCCGSFISASWRTSQIIRN